MSPNEQPYWYKDAVIYQLHVKAYADSDNDGIGDFKGLTAKLDYLHELGVNTLWLLPFYPSPLKDDGYDISSYRDVHPSYGTMEDFRHFITEAHARGLRIITELVVNHTSDQHEWFQRARQAPLGSPERDFYVWSDDDQAYAGTRIIFSDTETSNWSFDSVAKQYYWHRFFSHQPDLNFDNPLVLDEIIQVMYFWLEMGVDGLRLDAVPYLCEREGTNNENLPETHAVIKRLRAALDARFPDRVLLAEANQWPEDVQAYFGEGDECHMAFHFPLMPRIYMAVAQEDRHPITDIMHQTPDIPENCQWAMFLRNHDELTLEMVTDRERDYLWNYYASDKRARINFGIRRRLAPLMSNDRRKIELLNSVLMSMPGTPVMYYGDEIGMGDNIFLGDRDGVRTPMQWSPDRNGGFSRAEPAQLYLPAIMDTVYGFQGLNVEAQSRMQHSLLNWTKSLLAVRSRVAFGRGRLRFLTPSNRKVLAYLREHEGDAVLCVANLSHAPQPVQLDLREFKGYQPLELLSESVFPLVGELPYFITLSPYGFFWFRLSLPDTAPEALAASPELVTLIARSGFASLQQEPTQSALEARILPAFLQRQRWYRRGSEVAHAPSLEVVTTWRIAEPYQLWLLRSRAESSVDYYVMGVGIAWESLDDNPQERLSSRIISRVRQVNRVGILYDAGADEAFLQALMRHLAAEHTLESEAGRLIFTAFASLPALEDEAHAIAVTPLQAEQSNSSALIGDAMIFKLVRHPEAGGNLEEEVSDFLTRQQFARTARLLGSIRIEGVEAEPFTVGLLQAAIRNQGDGWQMTLDYLRGQSEQAVLDDAATLPLAADYYATLAGTLGARTRELHDALGSGTEPAFQAEPFTPEDVERLKQDMETIAERAFGLLDAGLAHFRPELAEAASALLARRKRVRALAEQWLAWPLAGRKIRVHGDFHLGQVLVTEHDFTIIDFEGEPSRTVAERRRKTSPFKDVAGMLRSFEYAAATAGASAKPANAEVKTMLDTWCKEAQAAFLKGYGDIDAQAQRLVRFFTLEKALYEIIYEAQHRPDWLSIPVQGALALTKGDE